MCIRDRTGTAPLPGGDMPKGFSDFLAGFRSRYPFLPEATALRLARAYGTRAARFLDGAAALSDLGEDFGGGRQLLIDVKRAGTIADCPDRVHVLLIHETAMSVTESGVMVSM